MKKIISFLLVICLLICFTACNNNERQQDQEPANPTGKITESGIENYDGKGEDEVDKTVEVNLIIDKERFEADLYNNQDTKKFIDELPMTLDMSDFNNNEKMYDLSFSLSSSNTEQPNTMNAGDIMIWSSNTLVMFYKSFTNSYGSYIRLGKVNDIDGFVSAVGIGDVTVTIERK